MKFLFCLVALLPCILASEWETIKCPDGKECPIGKTCCEEEFEGLFQCCDLEKGDALNKKMIPGVFSNPTVRVTLAKHLGLSKENTCSGTLCDDMCCTAFTDADCCSNKKNCCPNKYSCCGNSTSPAWCCPEKFRCHQNYGYCVSGAAVLNPAISILLAAILFMVYKLF